MRLFRTRTDPTMPCLVLTGHPASGKSTLARLLVEAAQQHGLTPVVIDEDTACPDVRRPQRYASSADEKKTRAAVKSALDRALGQATSTTLLIVDSLNYIKGFRYELHCLSKAAGQQHGVVWADNELHVEQAWNRLRRDAYTEQQLLELVQRYEPPDERNRWDAPLFRVDMRPTNTATTPAKDSTSTTSVYNMHGVQSVLGQGTGNEPETTTPNEPAKLKTSTTFKRSTFRKRNKPTAPVVMALTEEAIAAVNAIHESTVPESAPSPAPVAPAVDAAPCADIVHEPIAAKSLEERVSDLLTAFLTCKPLKQGTSTARHTASDANVLHDADSIALKVCQALTAAQSKTTSTTLTITIADAPLQLHATRRLSPTELRRLRRQYVAWVATYPPTDTSEAGIAKSFLAYIGTQR